MVSHNLMTGHEEDGDREARHAGKKAREVRSRSRDMLPPAMGCQ